MIRRVMIAAFGLFSIMLALHSIRAALDNAESERLDGIVQDHLSAGNRPERGSVSELVTLLVQQGEQQPGLASVSRGRALLSLASSADPADSKHLGAAAKDSLTAGISLHPNTAGVWRSLIAAELISVGVTRDLDRLSRASLQLDGGNPLTAITLVEIVIRYPSGFLPTTSSDVLALVRQLEKSRLRRSLAQLYARLGEKERQKLLSVADNPDRIKRLARRYLR